MWLDKGPQVKERGAQSLAGWERGPPQGLARRRRASGRLGGGGWAKGPCGEESVCGGRWREPGGAAWLCLCVCMRGGASKRWACQEWDSNPRLQGRLRPERSALDRSAILTAGLGASRLARLGAGVARWFRGAPSPGGVGASATGQAGLEEARSAQRGARARRERPRGRIPNRDRLGRTRPVLAGARRAHGPPAPARAVLASPLPYPGARTPYPVGDRQGAQVRFRCAVLDRTRVGAGAGAGPGPRARWCGLVEGAFVASGVGSGGGKGRPGHRVGLDVGEGTGAATAGAAVLVSIVVSIPACHAGDRGSIPRRGGSRSLFWRSPVCPSL